MFPDAPQILTSGGSERSEAERGRSHALAVTRVEAICLAYTGFSVSPKVSALPVPMLRQVPA